LALGLSLVDAARGKKVFHVISGAGPCMHACALVVLASRLGIKRRLHYFTNHIFSIFKPLKTSLNIIRLAAPTSSKFMGPLACVS